MYDNAGNFVARAVTGGNLNAPWGLAIAPTSFGIFGGALLVGNFGDGIINAYDSKSFAFLGQLADGNGNTLVYASLWELVFGNTPTTAGNLNTLYFTAGLTNEAHGLLGAISVTPTANGTPTFGFSASTSAVTVPDGTQAQVTLGVAPTNGFSGTVNLICSGLPTATTCAFSPTTITASANAPATSTLTITTTKMAANQHSDRATGITLALLLPFGALIILPRRRPYGTQRPVRLLGVLGVMLLSSALLISCSSDKVPPSTPTGTVPVMIEATSGSIMQTATVSLTVQ